jgi:two-component system chemotaxis response regulator CheB
MKGRKIHFHTGTNSVECRLLGESAEAKRLKAIRDDLFSRKRRVLVVDDSPAVRKLFTIAVNSSKDLEVVGQAGDPYEARELLLQTDPDVILLDIIMPHMNGLDFLKKISTYFPKPVVIVSTIAKDGSDIAHKAMQYGAMEIIDKEKLELYKGLEVIKNEILPKIRSAMRKFR